MAGENTGKLMWDKEDMLYLQELNTLIFSVFLFQPLSSFLPLFIIATFFLNCPYVFTLGKFSFIRYFYGNTWTVGLVFQPPLVVFLALSSPSVILLVPSSLLLCSVPFLHQVPSPQQNACFPLPPESHEACNENIWIKAKSILLLKDKVYLLLTQSGYWAPFNTSCKCQRSEHQILTWGSFMLCPSRESYSTRRVILSRNSLNWFYKPTFKAALWLQFPIHQILLILRLHLSPSDNN